MKWSDLGERLNEASIGLNASPVYWPDLLPGVDLADAFSQIDQQTETSVDAAVRVWTRTGEWPALTKPERAMLSVRLHFAADLAWLLHRTVRVTTQRLVQEEDRLEWLLIEAWEVVGFGQILGTLECIRSDEQPGTAPENFSGGAES